MRGFALWRSCIGTVFFLGILGGVISYFENPVWIIGGAIIVASYYLAPRVEKRAYIPAFFTNLGVGIVAWVVFVLIKHHATVLHFGSANWLALWIETKNFFFSSILLVSVVGAWIITMTVGWSKQKQQERVSKFKADRKKQRVHHKRKKK